MKRKTIKRKTMRMQGKIWLWFYKFFNRKQTEKSLEVLEELARPILPGANTKTVDGETRLTEWSLHSNPKIQRGQKFKNGKWVEWVGYGNTSFLAESQIKELK